MRKPVFHPLRGKRRSKRDGAKRGAPGESAWLQGITIDREPGDLIGKPDRANKYESIALAERQGGNGGEGCERYGALWAVRMIIVDRSPSGVQASMVGDDSNAASSLFSVTANFSSYVCARSRRTLRAISSPNWMDVSVSLRQ